MKLKTKKIITVNAGFKRVNLPSAGMNEMCPGYGSITNRNWFLKQATHAFAVQFRRKTNPLNVFAGLLM